MIKHIVLFILLYHAVNVYAQDVQWASKVIDYSSELSSKEFSAQQVIGKPDVLPQGGDSPSAWLPLNPDKMEYIKVWFDTPSQIQQIVIAESYNPSATYQVFVYDQDSREYLLNTFSPLPVAQQGRLLHFFFERTEYKVSALKLVINGLAVPGYNGIDAIGISDSGIPVEVSIMEARNVSAELDSEKLGQSINSEYEEIRPILTPDGQTLFFSRKNHPQNTGGTADPEDIWYSNYDHDIQEWMEAINPGQPENNQDANFVSSISPDGRSMTMILGNRYQKNNSMKPGVSVSTRSSSGWSDPVPVNINNAFIENNDGHYFLTQNRETMIMAVERFDTHGRKDLYVTYLLPDGTWNEPMNLGKNINTSSDENSPFLAADNETLYFSSKGYSGYGGYDIYISRRLDDSWLNWSEPENLGEQINSVEDEVFFTIPLSGEFAYYSKSNTELDADIYRIKLPIFFKPEPIAIMKGHIYRSGTRIPVFAMIKYEIFPDETETGYTKSDSTTGDYEIVFPLGSNYKYIVELDGHALLEDTVNLVYQESYKEIERDLFIDPDLLDGAIASSALAKRQEAVKEDMDTHEETESIIEINDGVLSIGVHFSFDSDVIWKNSYPHLDRIVNLLNSTPVNIILAGHTDNTGPETYNQSLSTRRAQSVYTYFVDKGIDPNKIKIIGYGESRPLTTNDTIEGRRRNRRVDFIRADKKEAYDQKFGQ